LASYATFKVAEEALPEMKFITALGAQLRTALRIVSAHSVARLVVALTRRRVAEGDRELQAAYVLVVHCAGDLHLP